jgi:hypothetical protein
MRADDAEFTGCRGVYPTPPFATSVVLREPWCSAFVTHGFGDEIDMGPTSVENLGVWYAAALSR